jgi:hypothetical protein
MIRKKDTSGIEESLETRGILIPAGATQIHLAGRRARYNFA